ncbi:MAG: cupin domain-containing protein [Acidobacteriota bacterium]
MKNQNDDQGFRASLTRRNFVAGGSAGLAAAALGSIAAAQSATPQTFKRVSDPGQNNIPLLKENPSSNNPPATDHGDTGAIWYSFDLAHRRQTAGGWTHQVTQRELPNSTDVAGVNMRLAAGGFRELHWHTAAEWAMMLYGSARISVLRPDGSVFLDDVKRGDLWYFPPGFPHSIQGLGKDGCEFLLVFDQGKFSEEDTFLLSDWVRHTPPDVLQKNMKLDAQTLSRFPKEDLYIFPSTEPGSLAADKASVGGESSLSTTRFSFPLMEMEPTISGPGGNVRIVDSRNFPPSTTIAAALVTLHPGAMRELHWHPTGSEWQFYLEGQARMTVFVSPSNARTMDFHPNDVGFVPSMAGHYIENTGDTDLVFLEILRTNQYADFSLNNWLRHLPPEMVAAHLNITPAAIKQIPSKKLVVIS